MYSSTSYSRTTAGDLLLSRVANELVTLNATDVMVDDTDHLGVRLAVTPELHVVRAVSVQNLTPEDPQAPPPIHRGLPPSFRPSWWSME